MSHVYGNQSWGRRFGISVWPARDNTVGVMVHCPQPPNGARRDELMFLTRASAARLAEALVRAAAGKE